MSEADESVISINSVYRITWTDPPALRDFQSNAEKGIELDSTSAEAERLHDGISVFRTHSQARKIARRRALAWQRLPRSDRHSRRCGRSNRENYEVGGTLTLWADAESILSWVTGVEPVTLPEK